MHWNLLAVADELLPDFKSQHKRCSEFPGVTHQLAGFSQTIAITTFYEFLATVQSTNAGNMFSKCPNIYIKHIPSYLYQTDWFVLFVRQWRCSQVSD